EGEELPAVLQLVVDVSGSMDDPAPGADNGDSKWDVTRKALRNAIDAMPDSVSVGVLYYPNRDVSDSTDPRPVDRCVNVDAMIPIDMLGPQGDPQRDQIDQSLDDANTGDLTPTHDAYRYALQESLIPYMTSARKFMLLITDGEPTMRLECIGQTGNNVMDQPTQPIIDEIAGAFAQDIRTFLIGSPGSQESSESMTDMRPWLSRAAIEGGTAPDGCMENGPDYCHLDMTQEPDFAQALTDGLASIVGQVVDSCTFVMPPPPDGQTIDPNLTNLIINWGSGDSSLILPDDVGDCTEGWQFNDKGEVVLCSATCDDVKADSGATVQLTFGCSTGDIIPVR
ncbi:MAG TPA: vWA domain-containing protein, partial [Polyangiaceae bacterium]|nr:vWA domain-containing protein [Polyangiaceae bacterium]